jgi:SpoVK/Ycf46/Vps4 family AAA+-type ATPase
MEFILMASAAMTSHETEPSLPTPAEPETLEQTGLAETTVEHLIIKILYFRGELYGQDLSNAIGLKFSVIQEIVESLKIRHLVVVKRSLGMGNVGAVLALTEAGRGRARECLEANQYAGPAPVPVDQYVELVRLQRHRDGWLTREGLTRAFKNLVVNDKLMAQVGPAVSSASSLLLYGKPGDGKTYLIEQLGNLETAPIYLPYALDSQGNIIQLYDPIYHQKLEEEERQISVLAVDEERGYDRRWARCKRPFIVSGGELTLDMLDLRYNSTSRIYEAPFQLKANNGIYLVDDFGRQRATPAEVLNRWIVPMERRVDYLSFLTGGKMTIPFETFLVFSTNLNPATLGDEAFLRRIQYKLLLRGPAEPEFIRIFERFCEERQVPAPRDLINRFLDRHYRRTGKTMRRCHPRDVLMHAFNLAHFERLPHRLTDQILDRAFESCFLEEEELPATVTATAADAPAAPAEPARVLPEKCEDYWVEQTSNIPTAFGSLAFAASFRDEGIGTYRGGEALNYYGEAENARVLIRLHGRKFREWLAMPLDQQRRDFERYLSTAANRAALERMDPREWLEAMTPPDANPEEVQLFSQDLKAFQTNARHERDGERRQAEPRSGPGELIVLQAV